METGQRGLTCAQAKQIDIVDYLASFGYQPTKVRQLQYWYCSPLRTENTASFKVNRSINRWYDFGLGKGGTLIDFAVLFHRCTVADFLSGCRFVPSPTPSSFSNKKEEKHLTVVRMAPLQSLALQRYVHSRNIPAGLADKYCIEVHFKIDKKQWYGIGFPNDKGGYEIRNAFFKSCIAPKAVSTINNQSSKVAVFEGFFDFLSFVSIQPASVLKTWDACVLHSLALLDRTLPDLVNKYKTIHLFLDHDSAGRQRTQSCLARSPACIDESTLYAGYKDLNDWIMHLGKHPKATSPPPPIG